MKKRRKDKKIFNLIAICSFCAILLSVSTYAWFIGMKTVSVNKFDVEIATTEGLFLSMDGKNWQYQLDAKNTPAYENNANQWLTKDGEGLIPMSSVGDMDSKTSRMKLYQKGSLTAVSNGGGYRLMAKQVENNKTQNAGKVEYEEAPGYVAFDLFVMNLSGDEYYPDNKVDNEEAIYLTTNSSVTVGSGGKQNTGIENSIRVGFVQLGRVSAELDLNDRDKNGETSQPIITKMTCANSTDVLDTDEKYVTGICRDAQIWEPNDTKHTTNATNWYNKGCKARKAGEAGKLVKEPDSYEGTCTEVTGAKKTYAISREINYDDEVNVYDGADYNTYVTNSTDYATYANAKTNAKEKFEPSKYKLVDFPYFTDTMKEVPGVGRKAFMTLAPNSITKIRVYVWLEGQDVDNYDFAQLGKQVKINFGFTKERFTETDVSHDGPSTDITDHHVYYKATGAITEIQDTGMTEKITYNTETQSFKVPAGYKEDFTFTDDVASKKATHSTITQGKQTVDNWVVSDAN